MEKNQLLVLVKLSPSMKSMYIFLMFFYFDFQTDYLRKISMKMLTMETKSQNAAGSSSSIPAANNGSSMDSSNHHMHIVLKSAYLVLWINFPLIRYCFNLILNSSRQSRSPSSRNDANQSISSTSAVAVPNHAE